MSEENPYGAAAGPALYRVQAMLRAFWVGFAQVGTAVLVAIGCVMASSIAARGSDPYDQNWEGIEFILAGLVLVPLGAMVAGSLVARSLRLANWLTYCLSVIAAVVTLSLGLWAPGSSFGNLPLALLVLTAVNLVIGYSTGMRRDHPEFKAADLP